MSKGLEIERKFKIAMPSTEALLAMEGAQYTDIVQTYLLCEEGVTSRVRRRAGQGSVRYTATEKRRITAVTAVENERELSEEEYRALLETADPALTPIEKRRITVPYGGYLLEVDIYPFWQNTAILEIELPSEDAAFTLPGEIRVIEEVTADYRYKNVSLARAIPAE